MMKTIQEVFNLDDIKYVNSDHIVQQIVLIFPKEKIIGEYKICFSLMRYPINKETYFNIKYNNDVAFIINFLYRIVHSIQHNSAKWMFGYNDEFIKCFIKDCFEE